jgi:hypothetical protein
LLFSAGIKISNYPVLIGGYNADGGVVEKDFELEFCVVCGVVEGRGCHGFKVIKVM